MSVKKIYIADIKDLEDMLEPNSLKFHMVDVTNAPKIKEEDLIKDENGKVVGCHHELNFKIKLQ